MGFPGSSAGKESACNAGDPGLIPGSRRFTVVMSLLSNTLSRFYSFSARKQLSSNFMAAVIIHSNFRAQEEEIGHCFHISPFYLP